MYDWQLLVNWNCGNTEVQPYSMVEVTIVLFFMVKYIQKTFSPNDEHLPFSVLLCMIKSIQLMLSKNEILLNGAIFLHSVWIW
jgi:hypothetical protein